MAVMPAGRVFTKGAFHNLPMVRYLPVASYERIFPMSSSAAEKHPYHHGDLRNALLDAARALAQELGGDRITLREVARRAGVSHTAA